ncbi:hypothetical protein DERA104750_09195 [Deinococcus radiodurans]
MREGKGLAFSLLYACCRHHLAPARPDFGAAPGQFGELPHQRPLGLRAGGRLPKLAEQREQPWLGQQAGQR